MTEEWISYTEDICYVTGKIMSKEDRARFTWEFDAWVSEEGQQLIENAHRTGDLSGDFEIIYAEWYAQDAAAEGRIQEFFDEGL
tara:strand:- start:347 stop:598 length:252 start_codon:yes stop_codon:yes gene_type:complete